MSEPIPSLAELIQERMELLGIKSQAELARRSGLIPQDINRFVRGGTTLPTADKRRKLAAALRVSHLDLLVAAREITTEEVASAGVRAQADQYPNHPAMILSELARQIHTWPPLSFEAIQDQLTKILEWQQRTSEKQ